MSAVKSFLVAAVLSVAFVGAAQARDVFTVKLAAPVAEQSQVIALNTVWSCEGDTCVARPGHDANVRSCRQLLRELDGATIVSYGPESRQLSGDEIARCNGNTAAASQQAAN